jgi:hypothetical protein
MGSVWESRFERKGIKQPTVKSHILKKGKKTKKVTKEEDPKRAALAFFFFFTTQSLTGF